MDEYGYSQKPLVNIGGQVLKVEAGNKYSRLWYRKYFYFPIITVSSFCLQERCKLTLSLNAMFVMVKGS